MPLTKRDNEFAVPSISPIAAKRVDLERAMTNLLIQLRFGGVPTIRAKAKVTKVEDLADEACSRDQMGLLKGFAEHRDIVYRWLESDLLDLVSRGNPNKENLSTARPLHLNAYRLRNPKYCQDFGVSTAVYNLLVWEAGDVIKDLVDFFGEGLDPYTDQYDGVSDLDIETTLLLRLATNAPREQVDPRKKAPRAFPLCVGQARLFADDLRRILVYKDQVPRVIMIDYLKNVIGLHLGLYTIHLFALVPELVERGAYPEACARCHDSRAGSSECMECPVRASVIVDLADDYRTRMAELARQSVVQVMGMLDRYVKTHMTARKLFEYGQYLANSGLIDAAPHDVPDILALRDSPDAVTFQAYFMQRITSLMDPGDDEAEPDARLIEVRQLGLPPLETYIEMLFLLRQRYHAKYYPELLDSLFQKNQDSGLLRQGWGKINKRRFTIGSQMLETLAQIAVLKPAGNGFVTEPLLVDKFLEFLSERYGIHVATLPAGMEATPADLAALRDNAAEFKRRLREIGYYTDLSDAYITQTIRPRYKVEAAA